MQAGPEITRAQIVAEPTAAEVEIESEIAVCPAEAADHATRAHLAEVADPAAAARGLAVHAGLLA